MSYSLIKYIELFSIQSSNYNTIPFICCNLFEVKLFLDCFLSYPKINRLHRKSEFVRYYEHNPTNMIDRLTKGLE